MRLTYNQTMKKFLIALTAFFISSLAFSQVKNWNPSGFLNVNDGVLIYGVGNIKGASQINFDKKPAYITSQCRQAKMVGSDFFCFAPVEKGTRWARYEHFDDKSVSLSEAMGKTVRCRFMGTQETLETVANPFAKNFFGEQWLISKNDVLDIPNDKKIVCWQYWETDPDELYERLLKECGDEKKAKKYCRWIWEERKKALEFTLSKFKGTEWEPIINEEMEYVVKEYENANQ